MPLKLKKKRFWVSRLMGVKSLICKNWEVRRGWAYFLGGVDEGREGDELGFVDLLGVFLLVVEGAGGLEGDAALLGGVREERVLW